MKYYIGIDLGGTNIVAGVVNEAYEILAKASVKTNLPRPEQEIAADMAKVAKEAAEKAGLTDHIIGLAPAKDAAGGADAAAPAGTDPAKQDAAKTDTSKKGN